MSSNPAKRTKQKANLENAMAKVFFEKQEGSLCGQHCLNNAVQAHMFNAVDLANIGHELDEKERQTMAQFGTETKEYKEFIARPSINYDDTGYFGVQVLSCALKNLGMDLIPYNSTDSRAVEARENPVEQRLIVFNQDDHWFSFRRFSNHWLNLNSTLAQPQLLSDSYFTLLLKTFEKDGYTIFFVFGSIPENMEADTAFENLNNEEPDDTFGPGFKLGRADGAVESTGNRQPEESSPSESPGTVKARSEAIRLRREAFLLKVQNQSGENPK